MKYYDLVWPDYAEVEKEPLPKLLHFDWLQLPEEIRADYAIAPRWTNEDGNPIFIESKAEANERAYDDIQQPNTSNEFEEYWNERIRGRG